MGLRKLIAYFIFNCIIYAHANAQSANWLWAKSAGGNSVAQSVVSDNFGNVYVTGTFQGASITFGSTTLINIDTAYGNLYAFFLVKYDSSGNVIWAKTTGANKALQTSPFSIAVDDSGNCYVAGDFIGDSIIFGGTTLISTSGDESFFIVKYDTAGNVIWAKDAVANNNSASVAFSVAIDRFGDAYVAGSYIGSNWVIGLDTLSNNSLRGSPEMFLAKYNNDGNLIWARGIRDNYDGTQANSVACDTLGNVFVAGIFYSDSVTIGTITLRRINPNSSDIFTVKYDSSGNVLWAANDEADYSTSITTDLSGNCYVTGYFSPDSIFFGSTALTNGGYNDGDDALFFVKYDTNGNVVWAKGGSESGQNVDGASVKEDASGNIYLTGEYSDSSITFGSTTLFHTGACLNCDNIFLVKYDSIGNVLWATGAEEGDSSESLSNSVACDTLGNVYFVGSFNSLSSQVDTFYLGTTPLILDTTTDFKVGNYVSNMFVAKLGTTTVICTPPAPPANTTNISEQTIYSGNITDLTASGMGTIGWYSASTGGTYLGGDSTFITPKLDTTTTFYAQDSTCGASTRTAITVTVICNPPASPTNTTASSAQTIYKGNITELTVSGVGAFGWYSAATDGVYLGGDSTFITPALDSTTTFYVQDSTCGASIRTAITVMVTTGVGIAPINVEENILLYPNPSSGNIYFSGLKGGYKVEVYDVLGQVIYSSSIDKDNNLINLAGNAKGIYLYRIIDNTAFSIQQGKIILE